MSWVEPRAACLLVIGAREARLHAADSTLVARADLPPRSVLDTAALGALLGEAGDRAGHARLQVVVSDAWLAAAELPWSDALLDAGEAREYARGQLELEGHVASDLQTAFDDAALGATRLVCALPAAVLQDLEAQARAHSFALDGVVPLSACLGIALRDRLPAGRALLGVIEEGAVTLATLSEGRVRAVVSRHHDGDAAVLDGLARRQRLRDSANTSLQTMHVVDLAGGTATDNDGHAALAAPTAVELAAAARRVGALDFVRRPRAPRAWQWAVAATLIAAAIGLGWQARGVRTELTASRNALQELRAAPVRPSRPEGAARRAQDEELRIARMQWSALDLPLDDLFAAVRPPADVRAALLSVELAAPRLRANSSTVRLSGEARDSEAMTLYLAHRGSTQPFVAAELTHHEALGARGSGAHRFTMEATWAR